MVTLLEWKIRELTMVVPNEGTVNGFLIVGYQFSILEDENESTTETLDEFLSGILKHTFSTVLS